MTAAAEAMSVNELDRLEKRLGPEHPEVERLFHMVLWHVENKQYALADRYYRRVLAAQEKVLGADNPQIEDRRKELVTFYLEEQQYDLAGNMLSEELARLEKKLGLAHEQVIEIRNTLLDIYIKQGQHARAAELFRINLDWFEREHGSDQDVLAESHDYLAAIYRQAGQAKEAEACEQRAAKIRIALKGKWGDASADLLSFPLMTYSLMGT